MKHVVKQGQHLAWIAEQYGFSHHDAVWSHPDNAELKKKRKAPEILAPGDELTIPERGDKEVGCEAGKLHRFTVRTDRLELRVRVRDLAGRPRSGEACTLATGAEEAPLSTDGEGVVVKRIVRTQTRATLTIEGATFDLSIGELDPIDLDTGWQARLINLGYLEPPLRLPPESGALDEDSQRELRGAIEEFQCDHEMKPTGTMDAATLSRLREVHGC